MKIILFFIPALFLCFTVQNFAQKNIEANYKLIFKAKIGDDISENYTLKANHEKSSFIKQWVDNDNTYIAKDGSIVVNKTLFSETKYFTSFESGNIDYLFSLENKMIHALDMPPALDWEITDEKKQIGEYETVKAETTFRGRDYIAWFVPEVAIPAGPW